MTTKKRSKPRAVWVIFDSVGFDYGMQTNKKEAELRKDNLEGKLSCFSPFEVVKYVREVKRK